MELFIHLALCTAGRKQAVLDLTWEQIDFSTGMIDLHKSGSKRTSKGKAIVPVSEATLKLLQQIRENAKSDYVIEFRGSRVKNNKRAYVRTCERAAKAQMKKAEKTERSDQRRDLIASADRLQKTTIHTLRHTAASWMAQAGVPIIKIAGILGHSIARTTARYAHMNPEHLKEGTDVISSILATVKRPPVNSTSHMIKFIKDVDLCNLHIKTANNRENDLAENLASPCHIKENFGAGDEIRTHDPNLGKVMLYP